VSQTKILLVIAVILVSLWFQLRRDFIRGLAYAVFLCVLLPTELRIQIPGNLPQLTIYRLILISLFVSWLCNRELRRGIASPPLLPYLWLWGVANLISLLLTQADFVDCLKRFLDRTLEVFAFYYLISRSLRTSDDARRIVRAILNALVIVSVLGIYERHAGFNLSVAYLGGGSSGGPYGGIQSTFQHRILLGGALAMGVPLAFVLMCWDEEAPRRSRSLFLWSAIALLIAACYFTNSRGPWLALALALGIVGLLGSKRMKKMIVLIGLAALMALALKPGVWESLSQRAAETTEANSLKGGNFFYRLELWKVAWNEISQSPERLLFGCGPGSGAGREIAWDLSYRGTRDEISSWDNQWAYDLFQSGCIGFAVTLALYWALIKARFHSWRFGEPLERDRHVCILASECAMVFMMTNVLIFSKQLDYMFWSLVASGYVLATRSVEEPCEQTAEAVKFAGNSDSALSELPPAESF
jgi:O-antigen ligase